MLVEVIRMAHTSIYTIYTIYVFILCCVRHALPLRYIFAIHQKGTVSIEAAFKLRPLVARHPMHDERAHYARHAYHPLTRSGDPTAGHCSHPIDVCYSRTCMCAAARVF